MQIKREEKEIMLHSYCPKCEWFDEVFRECSSSKCEFIEVGDSLFDMGMIDEDNIDDVIHDFFDQCERDFGWG